MVEEVAGTATALVIVLAYVLIVQTMTVAIVLLCEFIVLRVRTLRSLLSVEPEPVGQTEPAPYRVGGGLMRW
jgi:hypothetical protein